MSAVGNARLFVNTIVSSYDTLCHPYDAKSDIFNPKIDGLKESSLKSFSEKFSNPPLVEDSDPPRKMTYTQLEEEVVTQYREIAPNLSNLFAVAGILDPPSQDLARQKIHSNIIEVLVQDHLRSKEKYALDPMASVILSVSSFIAQKMGNPAPLPQFADGKSHFYNQIFLEVYSESSGRKKREIVALLKDFQPQVESYSFKLQRQVFKLEGAFNRTITREYVKFGLSVALGIGSYFAAYKVIALSGVFFNSTAFAQMSSGVVTYMPALIVQISSTAYNGIVRVVVYVASTRLYGHLEKWAPFVIPKLVANFVGKAAFQVQAICYQRAFGPSARAQAAIAKSLNGKDPDIAKELLEEGMKAYQIWMYLVEQGPQEKLFEDASVAK